jgi:1-acyl-sn-glycerol-3-phosphate acyltransferase
MMRNLRATGRVLGGLVLLPLLLAGVIGQAITGPVTKNYSTIPTLLYKSLKNLFGIKVEFNKNSAPLETKKPTWFVANHMSIADFMVLGSTLKGTFAGKGDVLLWPGIAQMARAVKYIGIRRVSKDHPEFETFHKQTIGKIMTNFNKGYNTIMFPEGTTTNGKEVALFRAGLISMLYENEGLDKKGNIVKLDEEVVVQPVAIRVKEVEGKNAIGNDDLRNLYSRYDENNTIKRIWNRLGTKDMTIELTAFEPLHPSDFKDQFELINHAGAQIRALVAPEQKEVKPAIIPGVDKNKGDNNTPKP